MQTFKEIKKSFAEDLYSWLHENDLNSKEEYNNLFKEYIESLDEFNPEWEEQNLCWEAWYIRWYEVALKEFKNALQTDYDTHAENINDAIEWLDYLLTN